MTPGCLCKAAAASTNATLDRWCHAVPTVVDLLANRSVTNGPNLLNAAPAAANYLLRGGGADHPHDIRLVDRLCDEYFGEHYPDHLAGDGNSTPCRNDTGGLWPGERDDSTCHVVWADDAFMSTVLLARRAASLPPNDARALGWLRYALRTQQGFRGRLLDPVDGLYRHAYSSEDGRHSCCKWGRANGWLMASHVELLRAAHAQGAAAEPVAVGVSSILREHASAMCASQSRSPGWDGRFRQVVNETGTFKETSVTAMVVWSLATAIRMGDLDPSRYGPCLRAAWAGRPRRSADAAGEGSGVRRIVGRR